MAPVWPAIRAASGALPTTEAGFQRLVVPVESPHYTSGQSNSRSAPAVVPAGQETEMTPQAAIDKAFKRETAIFAKYLIVAS
jgi:hypothetical protein